MRSLEPEVEQNPNEASLIKQAFWQAWLHATDFKDEAKGVEAAFLDFKYWELTGQHLGPFGKVKRYE